MVLELLEAVAEPLLLPVLKKPPPGPPKPPPGPPTPPPGSPPMAITLTSTIIPTVRVRKLPGNVMGKHMENMMEISNKCLGFVQDNFQENIMEKL